jgi:hypothetical protein
LKRTFLIAAATAMTALFAGVMTSKADAKAEIGYRVAEATTKRCPTGYSWDGHVCRRNALQKNAPNRQAPGIVSEPKGREKGPAPVPTAPTGPVPQAPIAPLGPTAPTGPVPQAPNPPLPNATTCTALKQTMGLLLGFEKLLSNSAAALGQEISDAEKVIASLQQQITQLNQDISTLQQNIPGLQQTQQKMNDAANVLQDASQESFASAMRAGAKALGDAISQLQNEESFKQLQVKALQALVNAIQQTVAGLTESLNAIRGQLVKLTGEWYTDNAIYNDQCT